MTQENTDLMTLTADIVAAHVTNNRVGVAEIAGLIGQVYTALDGLTASTPKPETKPKGMVSVRASIKPDHLVSMIDGKPYKMLKRHIGLNGYTPASYREAFSLPNDYPMVAQAYAENRRALAMKIGLGRKPKAVEAPIEVAKPVRKPRAKKSVAAPVES